MTMTINQESGAEGRPNILELGNCRKQGTLRKTPSGCPNVMIEIACEDSIGDEIRKCLTRNLEDTGCVSISHDHPDWVFSIICFQYGNLVEMSVVIRQFFRSTRPGTEMPETGESEQAGLRKGGWVYETLKYHGLHGVPKMELANFLKNLANDFTSQHLGLFPQNLRKWK